MPDEFPVQWLPLWVTASDPHSGPRPVLDYRWGHGSPEHRSTGILLVDAYNCVERRIRDNTGPPLDLPIAYQSRWPAVTAMIRSIHELGGLVNPLIVVKDTASDLYWVAIGNQRLCAIRALDWRVAPCRVTTRWAEVENVQHAYPYKAVPGIP